jgi:hypothetical protein
MGWQIIHLICTSEKQKYFFKPDWTGQISLIRLDKSDFTRRSWKRGNDDGGRPRFPAARAAFADAANEMRNGAERAHHWTGIRRIFEGHEKAPDDAGA